MVVKIFYHLATISDLSSQEWGSTGWGDSQKLAVCRISAHVRGADGEWHNSAPCPARPWDHSLQSPFPWIPWPVPDRHIWRPASDCLRPGCRQSLPDRRSGVPETLKRDIEFSTNHDAFEVFTAHHRANATASCSSVSVIHDGCDQRQILRQGQSPMFWLFCRFPILKYRRLRGWFFPRYVQQGAVLPDLRISRGMRALKISPQE